MNWCKEQRKRNLLLENLKRCIRNITNKKKLTNHLSFLALQNSVNDKMCAQLLINGKEKRESALYITDKLYLDKSTIPSVYRGEAA